MLEQQSGSGSENVIANYWQGLNSRGKTILAFILGGVVIALYAVTMNPGNTQERNACEQAADEQFAYTEGWEDAIKLCIDSVAN